MVTEVKISELPAATTAVGTMQLETNDSGTSKRVTAAQLLAYIQANIVIDEPNFQPIIDLGPLP